MNNSYGIQLTPIPKDIIFPDELNRYLRKQIEYLMHENGMLKKHLEKNESYVHESSCEIENLKLKLKEYENIQEKHQFSASTSIASSKIVELSKKLRDKNSELESFKTKCSKLEKNIFEIRESFSKNSAEMEGSEEKINCSKITDTEQKKTQEKLNVTLMKMREFQNTNIQLKNELQIMNKYLQQETGETFEKICNNPSWRGRAQIICDLQRKHQELKKKIKNHQNNNEATITTRADKTLNNLSKENEDLKIFVDEQKKKIDSLKARCKMLETEQVMNKSKICSISAKSETDQSLLKTLSNQLINQQNTTNEHMKQKDKYIRGLQKDNEQLKIELSKKQITIDKLTEDLNDKKEETEECKRDTRKNPRLSSFDQRKINVVDENLVNRLEAEKSKLVELTEMQASRITNERNAHAQTQKILRMERQKTAQLENNVARLELDINSIRSGGSYSILSTNRSLDIKNHGANINDLKNQLEMAKETIKALKTRLDIEQQERRIDLKEFAKILDTKLTSLKCDI